VLCSWESPFADCLSGAPNCDYLSRAILPCRGAPITDTAYMGLTSCRWITITGMIAHPRREGLLAHLQPRDPVRGRGARCGHGGAVESTCDYAGRAVGWGPLYLVNCHKSPGAVPLWGRSLHPWVGA
jgi:hypothetical protein